MIADVITAPARASKRTRAEQQLPTTTTRRVPPDPHVVAPAPTLPCTVTLGVGEPCVATYADGRVVIAEHAEALGVATSLDWRFFWLWQHVDESDGAFRARRNYLSSYGHEGSRWEVRVDWGCAYVFRDRIPIGISLLAPTTRGRVRLTKFADQPPHTIAMIRWLAAHVARGLTMPRYKPTVVEEIGVAPRERARGRARRSEPVSRARLVNSSQAF